jgi:hypothetical protein
LTCEACTEGNEGIMGRTFKFQLTKEMQKIINTFVFGEVPKNLLI